MTSLSCKHVKAVYSSTDVNSSFLVSDTGESRSSAENEVPDDETP